MREHPDEFTVLRVDAPPALRHTIALGISQSGRYLRHHLELGMNRDEVIATLRSSEHARLLVYDGHPDAVIGVIYAKDILSVPVEDGTPWHALVRPAAFVPEGKTLDRQLRDFQASRNHFALVVDEYGGIEGLLTHHDILEAIAGDIPFSESDTEPRAVQRDDGSWLLDGMLPINEFKEIFNLESLPGENKDAYQTLGGFVFTHLGRVPAAGDRFSWDNLSFEIVDMDGKRIDKVLVSAARPASRTEPEWKA